MISILLVLAVLPKTLSEAPPRPDYSEVAAEIRATDSELAMALNAGRDFGAFVDPRVRAVLMKQAQPLGKAIRLTKAKASEPSSPYEPSLDPGRAPPDLVAVRQVFDLLQLGAKTLIGGEHHRRGIGALGGLFGLGAQLASDGSLVSSAVASKVRESGLLEFHRALQSGEFSQLDGQELVLQMRRLDPNDPAALVRGVESAAWRWVSYIENARSEQVSGALDPLDVSPYVLGAKPFAALRALTNSEWKEGVDRLRDALRAGRRCLEHAEGDDQQLDITPSARFDLEPYGPVARAVLSRAAMGSDYGVALGNAWKLSNRLRAAIATADQIANGTYDDRVAHQSAAYWVRRIQDRVTTSGVSSSGAGSVWSAQSPSDSMCVGLASGALGASLEEFLDTASTLDWEQSPYWLPKGVSECEYACRTGNVLWLCRQRSVCADSDATGRSTAEAVARWVRACHSACTAGPVTSQLILRAEVARQLEASTKILPRIRESDPKSQADLARELRKLGDLPPIDVERWCADAPGRIADALAFRLQIEPADQFQQWRATANEELKTMEPASLVCLAVVLDAADLAPSDSTEALLCAYGQPLWTDDHSVRMRRLLSAMKAWLRPSPSGTPTEVAALLDPDHVAGVDLGAATSRLTAIASFWRDSLDPARSSDGTAGR